jgi:hypothetical protein
MRQLAAKAAELPKPKPKPPPPPRPPRPPAPPPGPKAGPQLIYDSGSLDSSSGRVDHAAEGVVYGRGKLVAEPRPRKV